MFDAIIKFSVKSKLLIGLLTLILFFGGIYAMLTLPVDAVPDITNNQVQIVTVSPTLAPQEVEQLITFPVEVAMSNIMNVIEIRSVSRFGLSLVTVVFKENVPTLDARQLVNEQIQTIAGDIPAELGLPQLMPITTGLGEIYQYFLEVAPGYEDRYDAMELRTIQDWIVKRRLSGIPGIVEINSFGGYLKQYEVAIDPDALYSLNITISEVFEALHRNNQNTGGSYIEKDGRAYYIRSEGMIENLRDIEQIVIANRGGIPIHIDEIGIVRFGSPKRFGAMTKDGKGECVGGIAMMLKGGNAKTVTAELEKRVAQVQKMLPEGVSITPFLNRSELVSRNISTVIFNLAEGALIVFVVLIIFLGNFRAGLIVASVIPLSMLFGFIMMRVFGVSANLMSLGAIDFGIVVDGSIVIVEGMLAHLYTQRFYEKKLTVASMDTEIVNGTKNVVHSATFAVLIILIVFFPILLLQGIEGKMFTPMAKTLVFCILGALILSLTYVPMMASLFLKKSIKETRTLADRFFNRLNKLYGKLLRVCLRFGILTVAAAFLALGGSILLFNRLGAEFIPTLDEGDFAMQMTLPAGSSLTTSIASSTQAEKILLSSFPEIKHVVSKIGTAEVPTDPMAIEDADMMIVMKPFKEWTSASSRAELVEKMKTALEAIKDIEFNFSQPIQLRFNELMTGAKADIAIKLYGEDMGELYSKAREASQYIRQIPGADDVLVEQAMGLPQLVVNYDRGKLARYGVDIEELNTVIRTAYAGEVAGTVFENERRFDLVVRLDQQKVKDFNLDKFFIRTADGIQIPVTELAQAKLVSGPLQINRDETKRRIVIGVNVRDADIQQVVEKISAALNENIALKPGYYFEYGGQFENLQNAIRTLLVVIPVALLLILILLFTAFRSLTYTLIVFSTVPLSMIGGTLALWIRGLPFSISAGVGFIALFGVAVLNGILMLNHFKDLSKYGLTTNNIIRKGTPHLLRPVFLTGLVASLGFVPMAIATSAGAEVQRPLATVVIGGLLVSTFLTLIIIPVFFRLTGEFSALKRKIAKRKYVTTVALFAIMLLIPSQIKAQQTVTLDEVIAMALKNSPRMKSAAASIERIHAAKGESWDFGATAFDYSWGQINSPIRHDRAFSITQPVGSVITPIYKNALVKQQIATQTLYRELVEKKIIAEAKHAWAYYLYTFHRKQLLSEQHDLAELLAHAGNMRFQQGDITLLEKNMTTTQAASMKNKVFQAEEEFKVASTRLQWVCFSDHQLIPADTVLRKFDFNIANSQPAAVYVSYFNSKASESEAMIKIEKSRFFPEFSAGYLRQNILPDRGLDAWSIGASIPLVFNAQKSRVKQAKLDAAMMRYETQDNIRQLHRKVDELQAELRKQDESIRFYETSALPEAEALIRAAHLQLTHNEINIGEFIQSMNSALEIKQSYLEMIYLYNVAGVERELFE